MSRRPARAARLSEAVTGARDETRDQHRDTIRARRLFILGAGFSAAAGIPMTGALLAEAMSRFRAESPGLFERVDRYVRACFRLGETDPNYHNLSLSEICTFLHYQELREFGGGERWSDAGSRENLALRYFLAKEVAVKTPPIGAIPEIYLRFAEQLQYGDLIITFNWDTLLELSVLAVGKRYAYQVVDDHLSVFKLHGSINWRLGVAENPVLRWSSLASTQGMMTEEVYFTEELLHPGTWRDVTHPLREVEPFIVLPGFGKAFDVRRLAPLWYKPEFAFAFSHDIFIIGLSLARDDFIIRSLFLDNLPYVDDNSEVPDRKIVIINPDPLVRDNFGFLVGGRNVDFRCEPFSIHHLGLMSPYVGE